MEIFRIENLTFSYPLAEKNAIDGVTLSIKNGEFIVLCGQSGCGKTTFLKMLKRELSPHGRKTGVIYYNGTEQEKLDERIAACDIGFVAQNPENQIVTDKVWHELAFGLENMGVKTDVIRRRVGEMASFFGIHDWFRKPTNELSGGQKQLLNLASVMVMQPKVLILDEPTSQLDPIAASDFINTLQKLNKELGLTIVLVEHRLEDVFPIADKVFVMEDGKVISYAHPRKIVEQLMAIDEHHYMIEGLPSAVRIYNGVHIDADCPLTVKDGRTFISAHFTNKIDSVKLPEYQHSDATAVEFKNVWFRYERDLPDVMRGVSFSVYDGEVFCILGGNGTGKTTTLNVISGLNKAYRGKITIAGKKIKDYKGNELYRHNIALLPQNPQTVFLKNKVFDDFDEICKVMEYPKNEKEALINDIAERLHIKHLLDCHPYDLSGGEQQKCALAKMLMLKPKILLLDEPTKGIDAFAKSTLSDILKELKAGGMSVIIVTHDVEFACQNADRCALYFDGEVVSVETPNNFFSENNFYTTAANRISRHMYKNAVTCDEVISLCKQNILVSERNV